MATRKMALVRYKEDEFEELSHKCLWFCLAENAHKKKIRSDKIIEHCLDKNKKQFDEIMQRVDGLLQSIFGLILKPANEDGFFIMQNLDIAMTNHLDTNNVENEKERKILYFVVAAIIQNKGQMEEREMWEFLNLSQMINFEAALQNTQLSQPTMGGKRGNKRAQSSQDNIELAAKYFDKLLKKTFVQQLYLEYKQPSKKASQLTQCELSGVFTLGPRSKACLVEENFKKYIDILKS